MKKNTAIDELLSELDRTLEVEEKIHGFYEDFRDRELERMGKNRSSGLILAEILANFYTCVETLFLRISQFFENNLRVDKWHSDLLRKMSFEIRDTRKRVISDDSYVILIELMKFRHFKRYYFEFEYDWDKLDSLEKKYSALRPLLRKDLAEFRTFLEVLRQA